VCCSVLQCVAVCCSVLQCVTVCCRVLQRVAVWCSVLQCVAIWCSVLHCVAVCCSMVQCVAVCCSVLQRVAACCSVLHCVAVCCSDVSDFTFRLAQDYISHFGTHARTDARSSVWLLIRDSKNKNSRTHACFLKMCLYHDVFGTNVNMILM